jgi:predicted ATPase
MVQLGVVKAFLDRGGFAEVIWKGSDESQLALELSATVGEKIYDYTIAIVGGATGLISVAREHFVVHTGKQITTLIDLSHGQGQVTHADGTLAFASPGPAHSALEFAVPGWEGTEVKNFIASWRFYHLLPERMKQVNEASGQNFLSENGDNLSSWLLTLQASYPEEFHLLQQAATDVFPDLESILTPLTQFATALSSREKHLKRPVSLWRMSDGELTFLA